MFSVTWIECGRLHSVNHPTERVIMELWYALFLMGKTVRMWGRDKQLIA